ncbi:hypothetical protein ACVINW_001308 [Bradyrhizobium sp. USDA 4461]
MAQVVQNQLTQYNQSISYSIIARNHASVRSGAFMATGKQTIQNHVVAYFAWRFDRPASQFDRSTKVRNAFVNDEAWDALADTFNNMAWMQQLNVKLSQSDMDTTSTIGDITDLIFSKAGKKAAKKLTGAEFAAPDEMHWPL